MFVRSSVFLTTWILFLACFHPTDTAPFFPYDSLQEIAWTNQYHFVLLRLSTLDCPSCEEIEHEFFPKFRALFASAESLSPNEIDDVVHFTTIRVHDTFSGTDDNLIESPELIPYKRNLLDQGSIVLFSVPQTRYRECLLSSAPPRSRWVEYTGSRIFENILTFLEDQTQLFAPISNGETHHPILNYGRSLLRTMYRPGEGTSCHEWISPPELTREAFFMMVAKSRPTIIKNAAKHWRALKKWNNHYLRTKFGENIVHVKVNPGENFEGCEDARLWMEDRSLTIPLEVREQLESPDKVITRPADLSLSFSSFLDKISAETKSDATYYLEYFPIHEVEGMQEDVMPFPWAETLLRREHFNVWVGDGRTVGKLHFDPFDNLLAMIAGTKRVTLFHPHSNYALYEGHIREAQFSFDPETFELSREKLLDSTSMVMSPVDITAPNLTRYPRFSDIQATAVTCTIEEGDVLFLPSFWWHEVNSSPSRGRNIAVNYWFKPVLVICRLCCISHLKFFEKEFPCPKCGFNINKAYNHLLREFMGI